MSVPGQGVGPWPGGPEAWPEGDRWDPELLAEGDARNVVDRYRYWRLEAIVADIDARRHRLHVAIENVVHDANIGSVVRTANAFAVAEVHVVGRRRWNRRGAMVTDRYQVEHHHADAAAFAAWTAGEGLTVVGIDNVPGAVPLETYDLPHDCVLVLGQEGPGLRPETLAQTDADVVIPMPADVDSLNVAAAAAIALWELRAR